MFNHSIRFSKNIRHDVAIKIFISVLFLCLVGPFKIDIPSQLPITLQSLAVLLVAIWFGWRIGIVATVVYIFLGAIGTPVFAGATYGIEKLNGTSAGFFLGFILSGIVCGILSEKIKFQKQKMNLLLWFAGHIIILFFGIVWMSFLGNDISAFPMLLPGAVIKSVAGWVLTLILLQYFKKEKLS